VISPGCPHSARCAATAEDILSSPSSERSCRLHEREEAGTQWRVQVSRSTECPWRCTNAHGVCQLSCRSTCCVAMVKFMLACIYLEELTYIKPTFLPIVLIYIIVGGSPCQQGTRNIAISLLISCWYISFIMISCLYVYLEISTLDIDIPISPLV